MSSSLMVIKVVKLGGLRIICDIAVLWAFVPSV